MMKRLALTAAGVLLFATAAASGASVTVTMFALTPEGTGKQLGTVVFQDSARGLRIVPNLGGLTEGEHGFHIHQNPDCGAKEKNGKVVPGLAAGGHFDPKKTGKHQGPAGQGHLGDLPVLYVNDQGRATRIAHAPRLKVANIIGHGVIIHAGGDNYQDVPKKLGGGGPRVACGIVK